MINGPIILEREQLYVLENALRQVVRSEMLRIFSQQATTSMDELHLENAMLMYVSRIAKAHEEMAINNKVDQALSNAFDIYRKVHELEETHIKKILKEALDASKVDVKVSFTVPVR